MWHLSSQEQASAFTPVMAAILPGPSLPHVFTVGLTPVDPVQHMMEAHLPSIKAIIASHMVTLAQTNALEHMAQDRPAMRLRGGSPFRFFTKSHSYSVHLPRQRKRMEYGQNPKVWTCHKGQRT